MTSLKRILTIALVLVLGVGAVACGSDSDSGGDGSGASQSGDSGELEGSSWKLMNISSGQGWATSLPKQVEPATIEFADGKANIFAGCNSGSGEVEISDDTISFGPVAITKMSCGRIANQFEEMVLQVLTGEVKYTVNEDDQLILEHGGYGLVFTRA